MYLKKAPLVKGEVYHIFNRSINLEPIFTQVKNCQRAIMCLNFYRIINQPVKLSSFLLWNNERRQDLIEKVTKDGKRKVDIFAFCLMPNHFHLLLKQITPAGIRDFLSLFQNSYTKYFNIRNNRAGPIFQGQFKAVRVETDEQLIHLSRYIHFNPHSSFIVETIENLDLYPWSSLPEYLGKEKGFCQKEFVLSLFDSDIRRYKKFILDNADYQRKLQQIKHLTWD